MNELKALFSVLFILMLAPKAFAGDSTFGNLRFAPFPMLEGLFNGEFDVPVTDALAIGVQVSDLDRRINKKGERIFGMGLRGVYSLNGKALSTGWIIEPGIGWARAKVDESNDTYGELEGRGDSFDASLLGGYQWFWSFFNLTLAGGVDWSSSPKLDLIDASGATRDTFNRTNRRFSIALDFSFGFKF